MNQDQHHQLIGWPERQRDDEMSYAPRHTTLPSHIRPSSGLSTNQTHASRTQSSALEKRIHEKKAELENLRQLRDLSAGLAGQMEQLEQKLGTLSSGTEAVAEVLGNWNHVLRAIHMASGGLECERLTGRWKLTKSVAKIPKPKDGEGEGQEDETPLPQTLVRIPLQQAEAAQREREAAAESAAGA